MPIGQSDDTFIRFGEVTIAPLGLPGVRYLTRLSGIFKLYKYLDVFTFSFLNSSLKW